MRKLEKNIIHAKICPYCSKKPTYEDSTKIYGRSYGMICVCWDCNAYVGVHKDTNIPLGRLANKPLRKAKNQAHKYFDAMWKRAINEKGYSKSKARKLAYKWLSNQLQIYIKHTHIGMFDIELCNQTINLCKPYFKDEKK